MSSTYVTAQGDMVDSMAWRFYGSVEGPTEAIFAANPGLSSQPPMLPENLTIVLPSLPSVTAAPKQTVNLWD